MKKIIHKIKHHTLHKIKNTYLKENILSILLFTFSIVSFVSIFFLTKGSDPKMSELAFIENSVLGVYAGSVIPASCESYPNSGTAHFVGDTSGYCAGTAPVNGACSATHYNCAAGRGVVAPTEDSNGWYWWCGGTNVNGYWGTDAWCSEAKPTPPSVNIQFSYFNKVKDFFQNNLVEKVLAVTYK